MVLVAVAVGVGIWVGTWEAHFWVVSGGECPPGGIPTYCAPPIREPQFAWWLCALLGAGAAALIALIALAVDRWPSAPDSN